MPETIDGMSVICISPEFINRKRWGYRTGTITRESSPASKIRQIFAEKPAEFDPRKYLGPGRDAIREMVRHKLHVLGCAGKAAECA